MSRLRKFSQPSEVQEPIELVRAGTVFHARGLMNTKVIQNNLDWRWPYWVREQFNPHSASFIPRAFSFSHINLTHRNWTAVGIPGMFEYPIVDPRGLIMPRYDQWCVDHWLLGEDGESLFPAELPADAVRQFLDTGNGLAVVTEVKQGDARMTTRAEVLADKNVPELVVECRIHTPQKARWALAIRPFNPEGVHFIEAIQCDSSAQTICIDNTDTLHLDEKPKQYCVSEYNRGDVDRAIVEGRQGQEVKCKVGLATAAAVYEIPAGEERCLRWRIPLRGQAEPTTGPAAAPPELRPWKSELAKTPELDIPHPQWQKLWGSSLRTLLLLSPADVYPGPYTYRRFWFRDACLMMNAHLAVNAFDAAERSLERFFPRQKHDGYFHSQEGEWDSNGQVLWIADRFERLTGKPLPDDFLDALQKGADWIGHKRQRGSRPERTQGLLPAGFSAEHLGPNDYYYWDDFWGVAGLRAAAALSERRGDAEKARAYRAEADAFAKDIDASLQEVESEGAREKMPASPNRRMDSGAIGSMVADYPLGLESLQAERIQNTADWLHANCLVKGAFFQDMIHSGMNAYLTLALAQTYLRLGDERWVNLVQSCGDMASPTGHWPEAVHPRTGGGDMGDGQHGWAAAEWLLMMRALFVRENAEGLEIGRGLRQDWLAGDARLAFGPTATPWGAVTVESTRENGQRTIRVHGDWRSECPRLTLCLPGKPQVSLAENDAHVIET